VSIPAPPDAHAVYRRYLSAVVLKSLAHADAAGLHPTDLYALNILELSGSLTAGALAEQTGLTTGAATRLIDRLEQHGHVRRVADPTDRRRILVETVADATSDSDDTFGPARRRLAEVFARYSPDQLKILFDYFEHASAAFQKATEETRQTAKRRA
jgi:DNA-binding MarR family transcriptional regulator